LLSDFATASEGGGASVGFTAKSLSTAAASSDVVDVVTKVWSSNPFAWSATGSSEAGVASVEIVNSSDSTILRVVEAPEPIIIRFAAPLSTDTDGFECLYWNVDAMDWDGRGTVLVGFETSESATEISVTCATVHLSDFTAGKGLGFLRVNVPNPASDFALLGSAFGNSSSLVTTTITIVTVGVSLLAWFTSGIIDEKKAELLRQLRRVHVLMYGEISSGFGMDSLHTHANDKMRMKMQALHDHLRDVQARGTTVLVLTYLMHVWWRELRQDHSWLSVLVPPLDQILFITRPQRIAILCVTILANFSVSAAFFYATPSTSSQLIIAAVVSALVMVPFEELFPLLFHGVNTYRSQTQKLRAKVRAKHRHKAKLFKKKRENIIVGLRRQFGSKFMKEPPQPTAKLAGVAQAAAKASSGDKSGAPATSVKRLKAALPSSSSPGEARFGLKPIPESPHLHKGSFSSRVSTPGNVTKVLPFVTATESDDQSYVASPHQSAVVHVTCADGSFSVPENAGLPAIVASSEVSRLQSRRTGSWCVDESGSGSGREFGVAPQRSTSSQRSWHSAEHPAPIVVENIDEQCHHSEDDHAVNVTSPVAEFTTPSHSTQAKVEEESHLSQRSKTLKLLGFESDSDDEFEKIADLIAAASPVLRSTSSHASTLSPVSRYILSPGSLSFESNELPLVDGEAKEAARSFPLDALSPGKFKRDAQIVPMEATTVQTIGLDTANIASTSTQHLSEKRFESRNKLVDVTGFVPDRVDGDRDSIGPIVETGPVIEAVPVRNKTTMVERSGARALGSAWQLDKSALFDNDPYSMFSPTTGKRMKYTGLWAMLTTVSVLQCFMGLFMCMISLYMMAGARISGLSSLFLTGVGFGSFFAGLASFFAIKRVRLRLSSFWLAVALGAEGVGLFVTLAFYGVVGVSILTIVCSVHALGLLVAIISAAWITLAKKRAFRKKYDEMILVRRLDEEMLQPQQNRRASLVGRRHLATRKITNAMKSVFLCALCGVRVGDSPTIVIAVFAGF
jgi:hypothetical protein